MFKKNKFFFCSLLQNKIPKNPNIIKEKYTIIHDHYRHDELNILKTNKYERNRIIKRENNIHKQFKNMFDVYYKEWEKDAYTHFAIKNKESPGEEYDHYTYYNKNKNGFDILWRKNNESQISEMVFDLTTVPFLNSIDTAILKIYRVSPNHKYISFVVDIDNNEKYVGGIYEIENKKYLDNIKLHNVSSIDFSTNSEYIFYVETNEMNRPCRIKVKKFNTSIQDNDIIIYEEIDDNVYIEINGTKDNKYLIVNSLTKDDSKISIIDVQAKYENPAIAQHFEVKTILKRMNGIKYFIDHSGDTFYILSNFLVENKQYPEMEKNLDFKLFYVKDNEIDNLYENIKLMLFPEEGEIYEDLDIFKDYVVIYLKQNMHPYIIVHKLSEQNHNPKKIKIGNSPGEITPCLNRIFESSKVRLEYSNPVIYNQILEYQLSSIDFSKTTKDIAPNIIFEEKISGIKPSNYIIDECFAPTKDGEEIPLTLFYKKNLKFNRKNKTLLIGYGAYGLNLELNYDQTLLTAVNRGWVIAYAHLRGGYEKGKKWHEMGKLLNKSQVIEDYLACALQLIQMGITHPNYLAGQGSSSGGGVVAQAINLKPEIFRAVLLDHPFLDILSTLLDPSIPLTITDYKEYGNPLEDESIYYNIHSYSPYENISNQEYPAVLLSLSLDDPRIPSWATLKYIEKLRQKAKIPERIPNFLEKNICVRIDKSGHHGAVNNEDRLKNKLWDLMWLDKMLIEKDNIIL